MHDAALPASGRRATPRPTFEGATVVRRADTAHHVWGDVESGFVTDRVYASTSALHVLEFQLAPRGEFRHSPANKTVFAADVIYCVRDGTLVIADPEHGEVRVVETGEAVFFRRDTWHHGFNPSADTLRVLEFFAPPPSRGTASAYARHQPTLETSSYEDARWDQCWPAARSEQQAASRLHVTRDADALWRFAHAAPSHLQGTLVDTEHLLVRSGRVAAGHVEDLHEVADETMLVVTGGELWVDTLDATTGEYAAACLQPGDAVFVPAQSSLRVLVRAGSPATYLMGSGRLAPDDWTP